jgi:hypothetical protein
LYFTGYKLVYVLLCEPERNIIEYNIRNLVNTNEDFKILFISLYNNFSNTKIPVQAWIGPEGLSGRVFSPIHRPPLPLPARKYSHYAFLLEAESIPGP